MTDATPATLADKINKESDCYITGRKQGSEAVSPPITLNKAAGLNISGDEPPFRIDYPEEFAKLLAECKDQKALDDFFAAGMNFRTGYLDGLAEFMSRTNVNPIAIAKQDTLDYEEGVFGFILGVELKSPAVLYSPERKTPTFLKALEPNDKITKILKRNYMKEPSEYSVEGYTLGFVIAIARDYKVVMAKDDVPVGRNSYALFMDGLAGKERAMPPRMPSIEAINQMTEVGDEIGIDRYHEALADEHYVNGLQVWLNSQPLAFHISAEKLRDPDDLMAFKVAIAGFDVPAYERTSSKVPGRVGYELGRDARPKKT